MYDGAVLTQHAAIGSLTPAATVRLHPEDFADLGVAAGAAVRVSSPSGALTLPAEPDPRVGRGTAAIYSNLPGAEVNRLLSVDRPVTDVRIDTKVVRD
jgi:NADH-quinone oxidoreductase subunit G